MENFRNMAAKKLMINEEEVVGLQMLLQSKIQKIN